MRHVVDVPPTLVREAKVSGTVSPRSPLSGVATASTAARGRWVRERGDARGRDKTGTRQVGLRGVSWPNTCPEGGCQGFFTVFQETFARFWSSDEPRRVSAWREVASSFCERSCEHRESIRIHVNARARTAA